MRRTQVLPPYGTEFDYQLLFTSSVNLSKLLRLSPRCVLSRVGIIKCIFQGMLSVLNEVIGIKSLAQRCVR